MDKLLRNEQGQLRNGWWILVFLGVLFASTLAYRPVSRGLQHAGVGAGWLWPLPVLFLLLVTWICLRLRGEPLASVGLKLDGTWFRQALIGTLSGGAVMAIVTALICLAGGVRFSIDPAGGLTAVAYGAWVFIWAAVLEELLFRGFVFQRLIDGVGAVHAQWVMAALFAFAHWGNPGMEGATLAWASIDTALGALLLGLLYLRTGSLALPIGFHFGWNWIQGSILGFGVSGWDQAGWLLPRLLDKPQWFNGGAFGPEASIFAVVVDAAVLLLAWRWKGLSRTPSPVIA